ncbi:MAG: hypothetical protein ACK5LX_13845 [Oscillospiraceae bacterium]
MTALEILAVKLPDADITEAERELAVAEVAQKVLTFCNIAEAPAALNFVIANMARDLLLYEKAVNTPADDGSGGEAAFSGKVSSISEGDTSVSFGNKTGAETDRDRVLGDDRDRLDQLVLNYREDLIAFRKVRWP